MNFLGKLKSKKKVKTKIITTTIILAILCLFILINIFAAYTVYQTGMKAKLVLDQAEKNISEKNFIQAEKNFNLSYKNFKHAKGAFWILKVWQIVPYLGKQVKAVNKIIIVGINLSSGLEKLSSLASSISVFNQPNLSFNDITQEEKKEILKTIVDSKPLLFDVKVNIDLAAEAIEDIPEKGILNIIAKQIQPVKEKLVPIRNLVDDAIPALDALVAIVGYPEEKNYLFLLQNNNELRPTGGFIGTYGVLTVKTGEIVNLWTDNIYNLDAPFETTSFAKAPWPIAKYVQPHNGNWFMRDCNWSPDFPTSADKALWFYQQESPIGGDFDGVIAIDTFFISSLIALTDNITIHGIEFTADNFAEKLQAEVEINYYQRGIDDADRKEIIGDLAKILQDRIFNLPQEKWTNLWQIIKNDADQRHLMIYFKDQQLQNLIENQNWSGKIKDYINDYLMVVDANLASLKTDAVMERHITYQLNQTENDLLAEVTITYSNNGNFSQTTTRYRTYTRIYVPLGSEFISGQGAMENDRTTQPGEYEIGEDLGKTYFGAFIAIEPRETKTLKFTYQLPKEIIKQIEDNHYKLYIQKQAGTQGHQLKVQLNLLPTIKYINYYEHSNRTIETSNIEWALDLTMDREFIVDLK